MISGKSQMVNNRLEQLSYCRRFDHVSLLSPCNWRTIIFIKTRSVHDYFKPANVDNYDKSVLHYQEIFISLQPESLLLPSIKKDIEKCPPARFFNGLDSDLNVTIGNLDFGDVSANNMSGYVGVPKGS